MYFRGQRFGLSDGRGPGRPSDWNASGFPKASTTIWIFGGQASARSAYGLIDDWLLARPGAELMRSDDSGVGIMAYSVSGSSATALKRLSQIPFFAQREKAVCERSSRRRNAPAYRARERRFNRKLPDHSLDEEPIAQLTIAPNTSGAARQQFFNPRELIAAQSMTVHREAFQRRLPMNHAFP